MTQAPQRWWRCPLDVEWLARTSVEAAVDATRALASSRGVTAEVGTSDALVAAAFAAFSHLRVDGRSIEPWAPFSGLARAGDGWVRLHGNYPHHAAAIEGVLGLVTGTRAELDEAISEWSAEHVVREITEEGGIATLVRTVDEWRGHEHARATVGDPWHEVLPGAPRTPLPAADLPLAGVRVLDLTRVLAGPTCTQLLACLGADVLRIDPPQRPEILDQYLSNGMGKRSAEADLATSADVVRNELLPAADVVVLGYRPGSLDRFGLAPEQLVDDHPALVVASLSAWGEHGPWGRRPGFDSIVQAATGIAMLCADGEGRPGALPVQALDYATGYVLAGDVISLLATARGGLARASLLGAARELLTTPAPDPVPAAVPDPPIVAVDSPHGRLDVVPPPITLGGRTLQLPTGGYAEASLAWR